MQETSLRVGVIGAGFIALKGHIPGFQKCPSVEVAAIADPVPGRAEAAARQFGIQGVYQDYKRMFEECPLDAVTVGTPNCFHHPMTMEALQRNCHVLCEKPLALNSEQAAEMAALAREKQRVLAVNMNNRARPPFQHLKSRLEAGFLGELEGGSVRWIRRAGIPGYGSWFTRKEMAGGGALMDIGVHLLDLLLWLAEWPEIVSVSAHLTAVHGPRGRGRGGWGMDQSAEGTFDVDDYAVAQLRLRSGAILNLECSWALHAPEEFRVQLFGSEGGAEYVANRSGGQPDLLLFSEDAQGPLTVQPSYPSPPISGWEESAAAFVQAIRTGLPPLASGEEGLRICRLLDAITQSSNEQGLVKLTH